MMTKNTGGTAQLVQGFAIGTRVTDPHHGFATITFVGTEYVGLRFEADGQNALFRLDGHSLYPGWDESVMIVDDAEPTTAALPWPDSTFVTEHADVKHYMGAHWEPFTENGAKEFLERLPTIIQQSSPLRGFGEFYRPSRPEPDSWPKGVHLVWPAQNQRLALAATLRLDAKATHVISLYPYIDQGTQTSLRLDRVSVWGSGVEAQIDAVWGEGAITFLDTAYLLNRGWYEAGGAYEFLLAGIAYDARHAEPTRIPYNPHPDVAEWERLRAAARGEPPPVTPDYFDTTGAAFLLAVPEWDVDDYNFRGPVKQVEPFDDFLGQPGWKVRVTVMRFDNEDADLDIYITRRAWQSETPPLVGQDMEGTLWLQGRLWAAPQAWNR
jgi:hypothetical protein